MKTCLQSVHICGLLARWSGTLLLAGSFLTGQGRAQTTPAPTSSAVASPASGNIEVLGIEPAKSSSNANEMESAISVDPASLLPDLPPVPHKNATLVGGTLARLDRVRDQLTINVFGGGRTTALFDPRTRVYRGTQEVTIADLKQGERIYVDTILDGSKIFAKSIRLSAQPVLGETQGVILKYSPERSQIVLRDALDPHAVTVRLGAATRYRQGDQTVSASKLVVGSLVTVSFSAEGKGHDVAREISILALPGTRYIFAGQVVHIDLRAGLLVLNSSIDHKTYEVYLDSSSAPDDNLQAGATVTVEANYQDARYVARHLTVDSPSK